MKIPLLATLARSVFALSALLAATAVQAQAQIAGRNINLAAVNLTNGEIYSVTFPPPGGGSTGSSTVGNTDESNYVRPEALAFVTNVTTNQLDLLIADNQRGTIYRYPGALTPQTPPNTNPTTGTLVWNSQSAGAPPGPMAPDALAVDAYGNLFVANSTAGHSQTAQLWEFPAGAAGSGSFGKPVVPVLLDMSYQSKETLLEVTLAPTDVTGAMGVSGGDLIVLTSSRVLAYSRSSNFTSKTTLLTFPNGSPVPGGMDFWPLGNGAAANYSLLISSNTSGTISRYYFTNPLTAAPAFYSGLGASYKIKTLFQAGNPLLFVSQTGSILELAGNANGTGSLQATVTQNVTIPQGLAVSNSFTNAASLCLRAVGCDLTGLLTHTVTLPITVPPSTLTGDLVEDVCTVNADPRVLITPGTPSTPAVWSCTVPYTPPAGFTCPPNTPGLPGPGCLPVNAMCPGFDDTGEMAIPDSMCGRSGSSGAGFTLIRSLMVPNQFAGGYVQNAAVLADGTSPLCGPGSPGADGAFLWAPLQAEGTVLESPNMQDITSGCGSIHGGSQGISVWAVGMSVNEAAPELTAGGLPRPLENFAQTKYTSLTTTIDNLTQANPSFPQWTDSVPNIAASVSLALWGDNVPPAITSTPFGCLDQSWLDFYNATHVADGSLQWTADLQNAANLLTNADATGNTTCDGIVVKALATSPTTAFVQTPNVTYPSAPTVLNPSGQLRSRLANLYYTINTRILGNAAAAIWPLPVSVNVSPTSVTLASGTSPGSATLSWNTNGDSGCSLSSSDGYYPAGSPLSSPMPLTIPASDVPLGSAGTIVTYTVTCTLTGGQLPSSVSAYVNVYPAPTMSVTPALAEQGIAATLAWNTNGAQGCIASSNDTTPADAFTGTKTGITAKGSMSVTPASAGSYTYTLACSNPATTVSATLTVMARPTLSLAAASVVQGGAGTTLAWNLNGNTGCTVSSSTDPALTTPLAVMSSGGTTVNPGSAGTFTYTLTCTGPATTTQSVTLTVVQQPAVGLSATSVVQGSGATLSWNTNGNGGCTWSSTDSAFTLTGPAATSGTVTVTPKSAGTFTYTLTCPSPTTAVVATLTVTLPLPPRISVSPTSVIQGNMSTLSWTINPGDVCTASSMGTDTNAGDPFTGMEAASGSKTLTPNNTGTDIYTLTCTVPAVTESAALTVTPQLAKIAISVSGSGADGDGDNDDKATLSWTLSNGIGCDVSVAGPTHSVPQFSPFPVTTGGARQVTFTAVGTYTYTLQCTNDLAPATTSVVIGGRESD